MIENAMQLYYDLRKNLGAFAIIKSSFLTQDKIMSYLKEIATDWNYLLRSEYVIYYSKNAGICLVFALEGEGTDTKLKLKDTMLTNDELTIGSVLMFYYNHFVKI